jgi:hypothetical protein
MPNSNTRLADNFLAAAHGRRALIISCAFASWIILTLQCSNCLADAPATAPATAPALEHIQVDAKARQVSIDCEALNVAIPLEFFCVTKGGNEHESVLRTPAKPSDIHFALLMLGLTPGAPATFVPSSRVWLPPHGPPLKITCRYVLNGREMDVPAYRMMRSINSKKEMPMAVWVFDGSRVMPDGVYAADVTGYVVSICNFDLTMIDVPQLVSNANETLEWEYNPDLVPPKGTPVTMVIEPAPADQAALAATQPAGIPADKFNPGPGLSGYSPPPTTPPSPPPAPPPAAPQSPAR